MTGTTGGGGAGLELLDGRSGLGLPGGRVGKVRNDLGAGIPGLGASSASDSSGGTASGLNPGGKKLAISSVLMSSNKLESWSLNPSSSSSFSVELEDDEAVEEVVVVLVVVVELSSSLSWPLAEDSDSGILKPGGRNWVMSSTFKSANSWNAEKWGLNSQWDESKIFAQFSGLSSFFSTFRLVRRARYDFFSRSM